MKNRRRAMRLAGGAMVLAGAGFALYALGHPEGSWPWPNGVTYALYAAYIAAAALLLIASGRR
ncbi:MAG TPA: hypothetical protein H9883_02020 [Candidatus Ruthenibacterium merdigallinarum]|nr:hypothetical protein [Candidatus Ruthenibacterium merdigallinarum]